MSDASNDVVSRKDQRRTDPAQAWQKRLLPVMTSTLVGLAVFFFIITLLQLYRLDQRLSAPRVQFQSVLTASQPEWVVRTLLEAHALEYRYHQANLSLAARIWTRYLGMMTGMILAIVGATFILGKLADTPTDFDMKSSAATVALKTSSPGIVLAVLGTILIFTSIMSNPPIEIEDQALYIPVESIDTALPSTTAETASTTAPDELPTPEQRNFLQRRKDKLK